MMYAWWRGDPLPRVPAVEGFHVERTSGGPLHDALSGLDAVEIQTRLDRGHRLFVARLDGSVVAWGWSATREASIGELGITFSIPPGNRYLWDFVTLPVWRGRGFYPLLLRAIMSGEADAEHFWIGHDHENVASARGVLKAGFSPVCAVGLSPTGLRFYPVGRPDRVQALTGLLGGA